MLQLAPVTRYKRARRSCEVVLECAWISKTLLVVTSVLNSRSNPVLVTSSQKAPTQTSTLARITNDACYAAIGLRDSIQACTSEVSCHCRVCRDVEIYNNANIGDPCCRNSPVVVNYKRIKTLTPG